MMLLDNNKKSFCSGKFKTLLLTASISMGMEYLMLLSDTIIIGNIFGESAIAATNLVTPLFSLAVSLSSMISIGTSMLYSYEMGKFQKDRANCLFGQGVLIAAILGIFLFITAFLGKDLYFDFMNPSEAVRGYAGEYYRYYQFIMLLFPMYALLMDMVYSDGDELICNVSYVIQVGVNIPVSIILCHKIGVGGSSLGTLIGTILSLVVLLTHFFRKQNSLKFICYFKGSDVAGVLKGGILDSVFYLLMGITACAANKLILFKFGDYYLPVLSVIISVLELTVIFDGIGQAITPLVNVYRGEKNTEGIRKVMRLAGKAAAFEGICASILLFFSGRYLARIIGITDPELLRLCETAIRFVCPFLVCSALLFLLMTYYLLIEKLLLVLIIAILKDCIAYVFLMVLGGMIFRVNGVWAGIGLAPLFSMGISLLFISLRYGIKNFPLLLPEEDSFVNDFDLILTEQNILGLRDKLEEILLKNQIHKKLISRIMLLTEELEMLVLEKNPGKKVTAECTLIIDDEIQLIFRDNGILFDITDEDSSISSMRSYLVANMMVHQKRKNHLVTTSYNRNVFRFDKLFMSDIN